MGAWILRRQGRDTDGVVLRRGRIYILPTQLDEKVARLQLSKLDAMLTELTDQQAAYIGVPKSGPYKTDHYRY